MEKDAIIIKDLWGKILSSVVIAGILGGVSFAFAQQAVNAEIQTNVRNLSQKDIERDDRINRLDAKVDGVKDDVSEVKEQTIRLETKIDLLLRNEGIPVR